MRRSVQPPLQHCDGPPRNLVLSVTPPFRLKATLTADPRPLAQVSSLVGESLIEASGVDAAASRKGPRNIPTTPCLRRPFGEVQRPDAQVDALPKQAISGQPT